RRIISWNNSVIRDAAGRPLGATSIGEDVTERRRADQALRALAAEQAALRRVATVVAGEPTQELLLETVTTEVGRLFGAQSSNLTHFEGEIARIMGGWSEAGASSITPGTVYPAQGESATIRVMRTRQAVRVDSLAEVGDEF